MKPIKKVAEDLSDLVTNYITAEFKELWEEGKDVPIPKDTKDHREVGAILFYRDEKGQLFVRLVARASSRTVINAAKKEIRLTFERDTAKCLETAKNESSK